MPLMVHNYNLTVRARMLETVERRRVQLQRLRPDMLPQTAPASKPLAPAAGAARPSENK